MKRAVALLTATLLSGCATVADGPSAASVSVPTSFVYAPPEGSRATIDKLLPNDDPAFVALLAAIETEAPDLQVALARVDAARAALRGAGLARAPNVGVEVNVSRSRSSENAISNLPLDAVIDPTNSNFASSISASWDLDLFGRLRASQRAASLRFDAADTDARAVRLALVTDIARGVIDYRTAQMKLSIIEDNLADAEALLMLTNTRVRAGVVPGLDLVRAQSLVAEARSQLGPASAELAAALGRLVTLTARNGSSVASVFDAKASNGLPDLPTIGLPSSLLRQRPDIVAAELRLYAANADIASAAAARFPQVSINAALGLASLSLGDLLNANSTTKSLSGSIVAPLIDFGRVEALIDARQSEAKEAFALYKQSVFIGIGEAESALGKLQANRSRLAALEAHIKVEQETVLLAKARYNMGISNFLSVIDTQRQLNVARLASLEAKADVQRSQIEVFRSFGG